MSASHAPQETFLEGFSVVTAEILYHMPDHPGILQSYVWQGYDRAPNFPVLTRFLDFWRRELDGPLHSVRVGTSEHYVPADMDYFDLEVTMH